MCACVHAECPSGPGGVCGGLGRCEGEGTRLGDGDCVCDPGYSGVLCQDCADGYYREKSSNHTQPPCSGESHEWMGIKQNWGKIKYGCQSQVLTFSMTVIHKEDINCMICLLFLACHHSCKKCSGPQDDRCQDCKPGWILHSNKCVGELHMTASDISHSV